MKLQKLYSYARQAIDEFDMIEEGDKIVIGISGGKDSLALLYALSGLRNFYPKKFDILAATVDLGYQNLENAKSDFDLSEIQKLCEELNVEYHIIHTEIAQILQEKIKKGSYCAMCAKLRKGALNHFAAQMGCNKVAYAHHMDDFIETMMLSLLYEGQFYTFAPKTYYERANLTVIRPFVLTPEAELIGFCNRYHLPCVKNPCTFDGITRREYVKGLIRQIHRDNPGAKQKMLNAILKGEIYKYWEDTDK